MRKRRTRWCSRIGGLGDRSSTTGIFGRLLDHWIDEERCRHGRHRDNGSNSGAANPIDDAVNHVMRSSPSAKSENDNFRQDLTGILTTSAANGFMTDEDKSYLSAQIAAHTGLSPHDASKRVDDAMAAVNAAKEKAKQAAETARKVGVMLAFLTAASLAVGAAAAWWAATTGGKHRDEGVDLSHLTAWR
jgi:hypothetical protein